MFISELSIVHVTTLPILTVVSVHMLLHEDVHAFKIVVSNAL